jgi:two-component system alkaline phosphatase synthesis response regulator PhoP
VARILIVDDEPELVRLVHRYLEQEGFTVECAYDGEEALAILRRSPPDLLLLDLCLPRRDGWNLTSLIRSDRELSSLPTIMLTARVEDTDRIVGLELGADDYIAKPFNPREIVARVRALLRRSLAGFDSRPRSLRVGPLSLDVQRRQFAVAGKPVRLTPTEFSLCRLFMENAGHTFRRDELERATLRHVQPGSGRTLDSHIKNLRKKMEVDPHRPQIIETVHGVGYRMVRPDGS